MTYNYHLRCPSLNPRTFTAPRLELNLKLRQKVLHVNLWVRLSIDDTQGTVWVRDLLSEDTMCALGSSNGMPRHVCVCVTWCYHEMKCNVITQWHLYTLFCSNTVFLEQFSEFCSCTLENLIISVSLNVSSVIMVSQYFLKLVCWLTDRHAETVSKPRFHYVMIYKL